MQCRQFATGVRPCRAEKPGPYPQGATGFGTRSLAIARTMGAALLLAGLCLLIAGPSLAQAPKAPVLRGKPAEPPPKQTNPMQVVIATDSRPGCAPDCAQWIAAEGQ